MKLTVKTLKGGKFEIQAEAEQTVSDVKGIIQATKADMAASTLKLIHSGKVLKDDDTLTTCGVKENDFLVVMVAKAKKAAAAAPPKPTAAAPAPTNTTTTSSNQETADATTTESPAPIDTATTPTVASPAPVTTPAATTTTTSTPPAAPGASTLPEEAVTNLTSMGFPEAEVRHCLRVAHGNPDVAVEFLTNGIPEGMTDAANLVQAASATPAASGGAGGPLQALRNHPQFNGLKRLVQTNPAALQQVLAQIGQQQPDLLAAINSNQAAFLELMNEPITETTTAAAAAAPPGAAAANPLSSPQAFAQMVANMSEAEMAQMAQMIGWRPEDLRNMAAQAQNQQRPGETVLRLTAEEMAAVDRLAEMGFDRSEAAQAFLACDKNEALAANLLMDSMAGGGGGMFGGNNSNNNAEDGDDDENMYD